MGRFTVKIEIIGAKDTQHGRKFCVDAAGTENSIVKIWHLRLVLLENVTNIEMRLSSAHMLLCHSPSVFGHFYIVKFDTV